jgi:RecA/RadA recombinase
LDRENAYTPARGEQLGISNKDIIVVKPQDIPTITDAFNCIVDTITDVRKEDKDAYIVVGLDSISAFDKDTTLEKSDQGRKAKAAHEGMRKLLTFADPRTMFLVANQFTFKIGVMYGDPRTSTLGEAGKYYSNIRVALNAEKNITDPTANDEVIGNWIEAEVIKTRIGPCYRTVHFPHFYASGIDYYGGYARLLIDRGYLFPKNKTEFKAYKQKTVLYMNGEEKEQFSELKIEQFLEKHPELKFDSYPEFNRTGKEKVVDEEEEVENEG